MNETFIIHGLAGLGGYLFGAIPFGVVIARLFSLGDLRQVGSGNIGATNVLRTGNKLAALLTLVLDAGKGAIAVLVVSWVTYDPFAGLAAGCLAVVGHNFPVWLKFKGGKGVATAAGVFLATAWPVGLSVIGTWIVVAAVSRYSSLAALIAAVSAPLYSYYFSTGQNTLMVGLIATLVFVRHWENMKRLVRGEETKIGQKKTH